MRKCTSLTETTDGIFVVDNDNDAYKCLCQQRHGQRSFAHQAEYVVAVCFLLSSLIQPREPDHYDLCAATLPPRRAQNTMNLVHQPHLHLHRLALSSKT